MASNGFADWRVAIDGLVAPPISFSLAELRSLASKSQITQLICEEGWSYIAEWPGVPLGQVLRTAGLLPQAKDLVYASAENGRRGSIDLTDVLHPKQSQKLTLF